MRNEINSLAYFWLLNILLFLKCDAQTPTNSFQVTFTNVNQNQILKVNSEATSDIQLQIRDATNANANLDVTIVCEFELVGGNAASGAAQFTTPVVRVNAANVAAATVTFTAGTTSTQIKPFYCLVRSADVDSAKAFRNLQVLPKPQINVCQNRFTATPLQTTIQIPIQFSQPVAGSTVTVTCRVPGITINPVIAAVDAVSVQMVAQRIAIGTTVQGSCTAQSTAPGTQYRNAETEQITINFPDATMNFIGYTNNQLIRADAENFYLDLEISNAPPAGQNYEFECRVFTRATAPLPACTTTAAPGTANWNIPAKVEFKNGERLYKRLLISRNNQVAGAAAAQREELIVRCCAPTDVTTNGVFATKLATLQFNTDLTTKTSVLQNNTATYLQRVYAEYEENGFQQFALCSCDFTVNVCDLNCCCDKDCGKLSTPQLHTCVASEFVEPTAEHSCANPNDLVGFNRMLCVQSERNALMGRGYSLTTSSVVNRESEFNAHLSTVQSSNLRRFPIGSSASSSSTGTTTLGNYIAGRPILLTESQSQPLQTHLYLPGQFSVADSVAAANTAASAACIPSQQFKLPLTYLMNLATDLSATSTANYCTLNLVAAVCAAGVGSPFNSYTYLNIPSTLTSFRYAASNDAQCLNRWPNVRANSASANAVDRRFPGRAELFVRHRCLTPAQYVPFGVYNDQANEANFRSLTPENVALCVSDEGDGKLPPFIDRAGGNCENVVVFVGYTFYSHASTIYRVEADFVYATAEIDRPVQIGFFSKFVQLPSDSTVAQLNLAKTLPQYAAQLIATPTAPAAAAPKKLTTRSGVFGYEFGRPLIGTKFPPDPQTATLPATDRTYWPRLFQAKSDGLCVNANLKLVEFGENTASACRYNFEIGTINSLRTCKDSKDRLLEFLDSRLVQMDASIAKYGDPDFSNAQDWVSVFRNISLFSQVYNLVYQNPVSGVTTFTKQQKMLCNYVPSGLHLTVIYTSAGKVRGNPIYQITGASVKYSFQNVTIDCARIDCTNQIAQTATQSILIQNSVTFIEAGSLSPGRSNCYKGSCDRHALDIVTSSLLDMDQKMYNLASIMLIVIGILFIWASSSKWMVWK